MKTFTVHYSAVITAETEEEAIRIARETGTMHAYESDPAEDARLRDIAFRQGRDGEIEVDADARVSIIDDPDSTGAYVQAWMWIEDPLRQNDNEDED